MLRSLAEDSTWPRREGFALSRGGADEVGLNPMRRRQRRMKANPSAPEGLAPQGASAALRGLAVEPPTTGSARLASAPWQSKRGSRGMLRQVPGRSSRRELRRCCFERAHEHVVDLLRPHEFQPVADALRNVFQIAAVARRQNDRADA